MATVNKPILLDETGKAIVSALQAQTEALKNVSVIGNPADYIVDCEYTECEVTLASGETITAVTSWYERYASGKVRQGGLYLDAIDESGSELPLIILNIPMLNNLYDFKVISPNTPMFDLNSMMYSNVTPTSFQAILAGALGAGAPPIIWTVEGMGANL
jgi:hypothetical protein